MRRALVSCDSTALALGAGEVATALEAAGIHVTRTGSTGAYWLEPLVTLDGVTYANATAEKLLNGHLAPVDRSTLPWFRDQTRLTFARCGHFDPLDLASYPFAGLRAAESMAPADICAAIAKSGLRGRGGAGFPAGIKWETVRTATGSPKYIVVNADEGDSGTFADRMLMEGDPFQIIEGMLIAARATGASRGYVYIRSEYPHAVRTMQAAVAKAAHLLHDFPIEIRVGAGSYICGEETALLESIEGKRGMVRPKPPVPALSGLFGAPTLLSNVLTFAAATTILAEGAEAYAAHGTGKSRGTLTVQLAGNVKRGGLVEMPFGTSLRTVVEDFGGGTRSGRPLRAVQAGGPLGAYIPAHMLDIPLDYEAFADRGFMLGHGGLVLFDDTVDMRAQARFAFEFCAHESCGKCTPCRIGSTRGMELIDRNDQTAIADLCDLMEGASLCALGGMAPAPVKSALTHFPEDFQ